VAFMPIQPAMSLATVPTRVRAGETIARRKAILPLLVLGVVLQLAQFAATTRADDPPGSLPPWDHKEKAEPEPTETEHHEELFATPCAHEQIWVRGEYLLWWTKNSSVPTLVTTGASTDAVPAALGQPGTKVLYGGDVSFQSRDGARFTMGTFLGRSSIWSVEANYFFLDAQRLGAVGSGPSPMAGLPVVGRPFVDVLTNMPSSSLDAYPGLLAGSVTVANSSYLQGGEGNVQALLSNNQKYRVEAIAGFRTLDLAESLDVQENVQVSPTAGVFGGNNIRIADHFGTSSRFYGGQMGLRAEFAYERFRVGMLGKVALGDSHEIVNIHGQTAINTVVPTNVPAGLLALSSNSGTFTRDAFAVVPELGVNLGFRITERLTLLAGYTFIYWSRVVRPSEQIDTGINTNLVPTSSTFGAGGPLRPAFAFHESGYWAQGVNLGIDFRY
jgi:hypothetical protein